MIEKERDHIIRLLTRAQKAFEKRDTIKLKNLSNQTVHTASIYKDVDAIIVAVTIYALSKLIERERYRDYKEWPIFFNLTIKNLGKAAQYLRQNKKKEFRTSLVEIRKAANKFSSNLKKYIQDVFEKAAISKASRLYEHGLSMTETTELLGISQFELSEYVGRTGISDVNLSVTSPIKERINFAKKLFAK
jgi:hypothetical protein